MLFTASGNGIIAFIVQLPNNRWLEQPESLFSIIWPIVWLPISFSDFQDEDGQWACFRAGIAECELQDRKLGIKKNTKMESDKGTPKYRKKLEEKLKYKILRNRMQSWWNIKKAH